MIVSSQNSVDVQQHQENKREAQKSSDRFARLLDSHARQQRATDELALRAEKQQMLKTRELDAVQPSAAANTPNNSPESLRTNVEGIVAAAAPNTSAQIHKLAEELSQQIDLHLSSGSTRAVDITFHSRSLSGLQVQIRGSKGKLSIHFVSQSALTAKLLNLHASSLKDSLQDKGLRIQNIQISIGRSGSELAGGHDAEA
jgi:flagellar hook-length control protein FliK